MRLLPYICIGGVEVGNGRRVREYVKNFGGSGWQISSASCACDALLQTDDYDGVLDYVSPADDNAPWFDPARPESEEFLGFWPSFITLGNPLSRQMTARSGVGATLGPEDLRQRVVSVAGHMAASSAAGMYFGERWLTEALRGCCPGCDGSTLTLLPTCPDTAPGTESDPYFWHLVDVGLIDLVPPSQQQTFSEHSIQQVSFQLASQMPYLFSPADVFMDGVVVAAVGSQSALTTTEIWPGDATIRIEIEADVGDASDILITGRPSFDGACPPGHRVMPCFQYRITDLEQDAKLIIDGRSERVDYYDPTLKGNRNGYPVLDAYVSNSIDGDLFDWPHMASCTSVCVTVENSGPVAVRATVSRYDREI